MTEPRQTPLISQHLARQAVLGEIGDCQVPLHYGSPLEEVEAVHARAGLFDISHLGRLRIRGDGGLDLLERVCTADVARQEDDTVLPTLLCNEAGGIIDQCLLLRLANFWVLTTSAVNRQSVLEHLQSQDVPDVRVDDQTEKVVHLLACGPSAPKILEAVLPISVAGLRRGQVRMGSLMIANYIAARTGLTRLWALEVMIPAAMATQAWSFVTGRAGDNCIAPAGQLARDVLRIEAGLCRIGREISQAVDPVTAGLSSRLRTQADYLGADAVETIRRQGPGRRRIAWEQTGLKKPPANLPTQGTNLFTGEDRHVGQLTSATWSPASETVIGMGYVTPDAAQCHADIFLAGTPRSPARITRVFE